LTQAAADAKSLHGFEKQLDTITEEKSTKGD